MQFVSKRVCCAKQKSREILIPKLISSDVQSNHSTKNIIMHSF